MTRRPILSIDHAFIEAMNDSTPASGLTHGFYRYPARFSPIFAREAIRTFTKRGDVVIDPFMGSGTTLVEAMANDRWALGTDINQLAVFVAKIKTTVFPKQSIENIKSWWADALPMLSLRRQTPASNEWKNGGYQKDVPWPIRKTIELVLLEIEALSKQSEKDFMRCVLLSATQWALDGRRSVPSAQALREKIDETVYQFTEGANDLRNATAMSDRLTRPRVDCLMQPAATLSSMQLRKLAGQAPKLVLTSPPYPGVHVLYHRWQIEGRRETAAPYWIIGSPDGHDGSYYTMGSRTETGIHWYFKELEKTFSNLRHLIDEKATVVQLVAFSNPELQLERYLDAMNGAGFIEARLTINGKGIPRPISRIVPNRKWHATMKGRTASSIEYLFVHQLDPEPPKGRLT